MKVTYVLKDGTEMDSMKGYVIPYREDTKQIYRALANMAIEAEKYRRERKMV